MGELIVRGDRELRRLNQSIAAFEQRSCGDQIRMRHLLSALVAERDALRKVSRCGRPAPRARL